MENTRCSPVDAAVTVVRSTPVGHGPGPHTATATVTLDASEGVFAGHYPGFPIFPGVCLIECAHQGSLASFPGGAAVAGRGPVLDAVERSQFVGAVFPGDALTIDITWKRLDPHWRATAKLRGERGEVATVRLRYRTGETE